MAIGGVQLKPAPLAVLQHKALHVAAARHEHRGEQLALAQKLLPHLITRDLLKGEQLGRLQGFLGAFLHLQFQLLRSRAAAGQPG